MNSVDDKDCQAVLDRFPGLGVIRQCRPVLGAGGFSGARLWRIATASEEFCLRRHPADTSPERVAAIHRVLRHVVGQGVDVCPVPRQANEGRTVVMHDNAAWELLPWMPGEANYRSLPSRAKLASALETLARFHLAAASYPGDEQFTAARRGNPIGLRGRFDRAVWWRKIGLYRLLDVSLTTKRRDDVTRLLPEIVRRFEDAEPKLRAAWSTACEANVPLQICLRDVWHAHVLFTDDRVTGLIDFDAMRVDTVATDLARLLGSFAGDDAATWKAGLDAYERVHPLEAAERRLVALYDRSAVLLTGLQWLDWILLQGREFDDLPAIVARLEETKTRLEHLTSTIHDGGTFRL